jgi:hypothetical protein
MPRLTFIPRWMKRLFAAFLLAGALATPLTASPVHATAKHAALGALVRVPHPFCPGTTIPCWPYLRLLHTGAGVSVYAGAQRSFFC